MDKLDNIIKEYNPCLFSAMPQCIKRRVNALKKIQLERIQVELDYHRELQDLELKYVKLFEPFNERRAKVISGEHEPTDEECQLPPQVVEDDFDGDQENADNKLDGFKLTEEEEKEVAAKVKGIPSFWLCVLLGSSNFNDSIESHDTPVLKHLKDVQISYEKQDDDVTVHTILFHFEENPYFTNQTLTKKYHLKLKPEEKDPFSFDGHELVNIEGCKIDWKEGKDPTVKNVQVKQRSKVNGSTRVRTKSVDQDSFFHFFNPPTFSQADKEDLDDSVGALASLDFELAEIMRLNLVPKAVLYYTGDVIDEDADDGNYDDDDDDEGSFDDEESDSDTQSSSSDSLVDDKKKLMKLGMKVANKSPKGSPGKK